MRRFLTLVLANLRMVSRNRQALFWTLAFPLVFMFLLGVMFGNEGGNTARVGIVDQDFEAASQGLRQAFTAVKQVVIEEGEKDQLLKKLSDGDISAVVVIPQGFGERLGRMQATSGSGMQHAAPNPVRLDVYYDPSSVFASQVAKGTVSAVVDGFQKYLVKTADLIHTEFHSMEKESLSYRDFLIPGILALALLTSGVICIATTVVFYRQQGILRRVQVTPLPVSHFMGGQVTTHLVLSLLQAVVLLGFGRLAFGVHVGGNLLLLLLLLLVGTLAFVFIGFFVSSFTKSVEATGAIANVVTMPMMFLGGVFFPVDSAPGWIQPAVKAMPVKYLADGLRDVMIRRKGLESIWRDLLILAGVAVLFGLLSVRVFRWRE